MDKNNVFDRAVDEYTLAENSDNIVLYGHNLKSGLLFGTLRPYKKDFGFYKEHSVIQFNSNYKNYRYKIFAVCVVDTKKESDELGDAHSRHNFENTIEFRGFVDNCKERSQYDTGVNVRDNAPLLTLSTCTSWEGSS
jgi:sortase B